MSARAVFAVLGCVAATYVRSCEGFAVDTKAMKNFGHSIKNGHLLPQTEITTFEHNCTAPPCTVTQLHCPTAGPKGWEQVVIAIYIDGETVPSISVTVPELANGSPWGAAGDDGPWGIGLMGHTAKNGGVYSTVRIPFGKSIRTTIRSPSTHGGTFWFIVRGIESYPVMLGDLQLPATARLKLHRLNQSTMPLDLVTLVDIPAGTGGAVLDVLFSAKSKDLNFLEACMRALIDGAAEPMFLSSGAEDYFLSAYYFNEGQFKTPNSGLTYFDKKGTLSAYKTHDRDPILFSDGFKLVFRNMENTTGCGAMDSCPNQYCAPGQSAKSMPAVASRGNLTTTTGPALYNTLVWVYEWPAASEAEPAPAAASDLASALSFVARLGQGELLSEANEDSLVDLLIGVPCKQQRELLALVSAYNLGAAHGATSRAARQLVRWLKAAAMQ